MSTISDAVKANRNPPFSDDGKAAEYMRRWGDPTVGPEELRSRFLEDCPNAWNEPLVTGAFFPGLQICWPGAFSGADPPERRTCAKHCQHVHQEIYPGKFII